jgi:hypothetical protein
MINSTSSLTINRLLNKISKCQVQNNKPYNIAVGNETSLSIYLGIVTL